MQWTLPELLLTGYITWLIDSLKNLERKKQVHDLISVQGQGGGENLNGYYLVLTWLGESVRILAMDENFLISSSSEPRFDVMSHN